MALDTLPHAIDQAECGSRFSIARQTEADSLAAWVSFNASELIITTR
jgi:hypothetical protein